MQYCPFSGEFLWKTNRGGKARAESVARRIHHSGYREIKIDSKINRAHRLAWLIMTEQFPMQELDHIDNDKLNNSFSNLREATRSENMRNIGRRRNNASGFTGVTFNKRHNKWRAYIYIDYNNIHLGYFDSAEDAAVARDLAAIRLHLNYARLNFTYSLTEDYKLVRHTDF